MSFTAFPFPPIEEGPFLSTWLFNEIIPRQAEYKNKTDIGSCANGIKFVGQPVSP
jgi:hypothetical protein